MVNPFAMLASELAETEEKCKRQRQLMNDNGQPPSSDGFRYNWHERKILFRSDPDEWMLNRKGDTGQDRYLYFDRVIRLGNALFTLLHEDCKGYDVLRQRFHSRATKPCFVEMEIASLLALNGLSVDIRQETGMRGEDFDFLATTSLGVSLGVEVTAKDAGPLTVESVINTLRKKRTQVPHRPAVMYIRVPAEWMKPHARARRIFSQAFQAFFTSSKRFNAIVLVWEMARHYGPNGAFCGMIMEPCYNNRPRHQTRFTPNNTNPPPRSTGAGILIPSRAHAKEMAGLWGNQAAGS